MSKMDGRILGLDYGKRRIGVAVSDPMGIIAQGLPTISGKVLKDAVAEIAHIVEHYQVTKVVVGLPLTLKGDRKEAAQACDVFAQRLKQAIAIPVTFIDERFTSVIAQKSLLSMGQSPGKNKAKIDEISAVLILQSYLDSRKDRMTENEKLEWKTK